ncbi:helix-turn-helix domain-containing protein [Campylobacter jejuni]|uniref:Helix-turn-helix domain-containing protein n=7 Tax=Campylobacter jejuni TaxID=197 RepID=A0A5T1QR48_CAMJU|nr:MULTISPECIES: XRE family transcriptional regulator [Campylobacter]EAC1235635.1 helix-turn-helix domain-containing protein [Campylobacter coli]EAH4607734.1 helix-turn-helix domain-containing protein [Campylobacter jejuni]EAH4994504.1 helix-turn-helix domain-containing protein [Campylobacter jejuni]EAH5100673.1 helix-turn-helix domain-containing protein [Campylobacter jejuni]EAH5174298.1 helix-turn-helix domain-containing protein [Campylobacter jejuni]
MNISQKIKNAREAKNLTQLELAKSSGVSLDSIKRYETKESNITIHNLIKIAKVLDIDLNYFANVPKLSLSLSSKMSLSQDKYVPKLENQQETLNDDMINIPFFENVRASAGSGAYNDEESTQALGLSKSFLRECFGLYSFINLSVILGQGDSMAPTLPENCYLLIQQGEVAEGEICVTRIEDELYVKRLQKRPKLKLLSDNKAYEPINLEGENFEILGRVVGYFKKTTL